MLALNGADQLNGPRQWGSLLFCLVIVLSLQRAEGSTEETGSSYTKIRILPAPLAHCIEETTCVVLMFEAGHQIIGVAHDDHVAPGLLPSPAFGPQIEYVVQVDVAEKRGDHRALAGSTVSYGYDSAFEDARLEPFTDQADDACRQRGVPGSGP